MDASTSVIDLTAESPPSHHARLRRSSSEAAHRLRRRPSIDALVSEDNRGAGPSRPRGNPAPRPTGDAGRQSGTRGRADDGDDEVFFVGMTEAPPGAQRDLGDGGHSWQRAFLGLADEPERRGRSARRGEARGNLNIHDGLPRGPHASSTRARPGPGPTLQALHSHLAFPPLASNPFQVRHVPDEAWTRMPAMLTDYLDALMRGPMARRPGTAAAAATSKLPDEFDAAWTHPTPAKAGFSDDFIEPPVDLDTYFDDKAIVTGPLPDTTPICADCRHALVLGGAGDKRIWVLPCGHVVDGRCIARLSGLPSAAERQKKEAEAAAAAAVTESSRRKGKARASEAQVEPSSGPIRNTRSRAAMQAPAPALGGSKPDKKPKKFRCPVDGCGQMGLMESGHKISCIEAFM
ncbi:uncharacterized protein PFL1_00053 [Pseudozyma flocculosa PF-1]|uniref:uncharacterized protein n=1 Tax=Pseudozyma flocculosa PF-1 TaxID=1277687 RepID=UPI000456130F|nr:uncharacterized protein PFL1_00053 [Pseudozyma flocculosa PF-1]EPQ31854.1 hypothetical protein PFL1_00053 [Pseudozyma flocculosa PF-1]